VPRGGAYQEARSSKGDDDEQDPNHGRDELVMTRRRRTIGDDFEKNERPSQSGAEHVSARLLRPAPKPGEQENQEDDRRGGGKRSAGERGVTQRRTRQEKRDRGEQKGPLHTRRISGYTAGMARVAVALLAILGVVLASAGMFVALAVGLPALGLNPYGRNLLDQTLSGLFTATTLYAVGAALLASAVRWMRTHSGPLNLGSFAFAGAIIPVFALLMVLRGYWTTVPLLLLFVVGLFVPIALGGRPWGKTLSERPRS